MKRWKSYENPLVLVHSVLTLEARGRVHCTHGHISGGSIVGICKGFGKTCGPRGVTSTFKLAHRVVGV